jgi:hypothetical protein
MFKNMGSYCIIKKGTKKARSLILEETVDRIREYVLDNMYTCSGLNFGGLLCRWQLVAGGGEGGMMVRGGGGTGLGKWWGGGVRGGG